MTTKQMNKANKTAAGLRFIKDYFIPIWIKELIKYLKDIGFIHQTDDINQIGINMYLNETKRKYSYSSISPHREDEKFSVLYSISIYSNPERVIYISFNLKSNKSNGDVKIPLYHAKGYKMQS